MRSRTIYLKLEKINNNEKLATLIPRLAMACNDISLSNVCLSEYEDKINKKNKSFNLSACMYFVRLQIGHIEEGLKIIDSIRKEKSLQQFLNMMTQDGEKAFKMLCNCLDGTDKKWNTYFTPIRNNISFHYNHKSNAKLVRKALKDRIEIKKQKMSRIIVGDIKRIRFDLGDEIVDTIVCRNIFKIPYDVDLKKDRKKLDRILMYGSSIGEAFMRFGAELLYKIAEN